MMTAPARTPRPAPRIRLCATTIAAVFAVGAGTPAAADPVAWEKLAQQPGALSAIATAISMSGSCQVPFTFDQRRDGDALIVQVACANTGDGAGAVNVRFEALGKTLFATGFEFEG